MIDCDVFFLLTKNKSAVVAALRQGCSDKVSGEKKRKLQVSALVIAMNYKKSSLWGENTSISVPSAVQTQPWVSLRSNARLSPAVTV